MGGLGEFDAGSDHGPDAGYDGADGSWEDGADGQLEQQEPGPAPGPTPGPEPGPVAAAAGFGDRDWSTPAIHAIYEANKAAISDDQASALWVLDGPNGDTWPNLDWSTVAVSAAQRVVDPTQIQQEPLKLCGSAAALEAEAQMKPLDYAYLVRDLFGTGAVKGKKVNDTLLNNSPPDGMDACDWMTLSAIEDSSGLLSYTGRDESALDFGTLPGQQATILGLADGCTDETYLSCAYFGKIAETEEANGYLRDHPDDVVVVVANDSRMLANGGTGAPGRFSNHWVRLLQPVEFEGDRVRLSIYTWGTRMDLDWEVSRFKEWVYGYEIGAKRDGILPRVVAD